MLDDHAIQSFMDLVSAKSTADAIGQGCITLGHLTDLIAALPAETAVQLHGKSVTGIASYRGYYERLALGWGDRSDEEVYPTAGDVSALLRSANGETYYGYKGGEFRMDRSTLVHAAHYGDCGDMVTGVELRDGVARLTTAKEEW
jgi:hypothetical protein